MKLEHEIESTGSLPEKWGEKVVSVLKPSIGRVVHFVQKKPSMYADGVVHLPAIVTAVWGESCVNLQVFTDGTNSDEQNMASVKWITSASYDGTETPQPRTWHWPENVAPDVPSTPNELSKA